MPINAKEPNCQITERRQRQRGAWVESPSRAVEDYLYSLLPPRDEVLTEIEAEAAKRKIPIVGPAVGRILYQLAIMIRAKTVFELGSAIGYSTIWWARAVGEGGRVIYTDGDRKKAKKHAATSNVPGLAGGSPSKPETLSSSSPKKRAIRHHFQRCRQRRLSARLQTGVAAAAQRRPVRYRQCFVERKGRAEKSIRSFDQSRFWNLTACSTISRIFFTTILPIRDGVAVAVKK